MKKIISCVILVSCLSIFIDLSMASSSSVKSNSSQTEKELPAKKGITISTDKLIKITAESAPLYEVLNEIKKISKINFDVTQKLLNDTITVQATGKDWPEALKKMLKNYNYANSWKEDKLIKIFIFEHGSGRTLELIPPGEMQAEETASAQPEGVPMENSEMDNPAPDREEIEKNIASDLAIPGLLDIFLPDEKAQQMIEISDDMIDSQLPPDPSSIEQIPGSEQPERPWGNEQVPSILSDPPEPPPEDLPVQ